MTSSASNKADRIFVQDGRRHYRRRFSAAETRIGVAILFVLAATLGWVAWKGAHPDPALFMLETDLSQRGAASAVDRGPVPAELAGEGWTEGPISTFDFDNLYVKINGREGYYKSFGFERLHFLSITSAEDAQTAVDIELYDLGEPANAVGAYSGERSPEAATAASETGLMHVDRNALFLTQGRYYLRAIGSTESPQVLAQLDRVRDRFETELPGEPLPWGFALFAGRMGMSPGAISYAPKDAFSFGFARNVYSAKIDGDAELFVTPAWGEAEATDLAEQYLRGFRRYGSDDGDFIKDRYMGTYARALAVGPWVIGVLRATDPRAAATALDGLAAVVSGTPLPPEPAEPIEPAAPKNVEGYNEQ